MNARWVRVTKKRPCQKCGRSDWCGYSDDGEAIICMRVESDKQTRNGGWLHRADGQYSPPSHVIPPARTGPPPDFSSMWRRWFERTDHYHLDGFAQDLGIDTDALLALGCAWSGKAWAFPMRAATGQITGIRLRGDGGRKWSVKGSKSGLFFSEVGSQRLDVRGQSDGTLFVCEGVTDTAAALTLGLRAVGRPSCMGSEDAIRQYVRINRIKRTVIIADNDAPGLRGAEKLKASLHVSNCTYSPPCKDLREFVRLGGSRQLLESMLKDLVWQRL